MDILVESTRKFENDITTFSDEEKTFITEKINDHTSLLDNHEQEFYQQISQIPLNRFNLSEDECSLYIMEINLDLRVIFTVDNDPIFGQIIFTLFRIVKRNNLETTYLSTAESIYQDFLPQTKEILEAV